MKTQRQPDSPNQLTASSKPESGATEQVGLAGLLEAARVPGIWLVSLNVFMVYIVYCGLTYFIPYLKDMYQLPIALVALLFGIVFTATDITVVYILTNGGPFNQTQMLPMWAFQTGIRASSLGEGAAISLYLLPILVVVSISMLWFARRAEVT